MKQNYNLSAFVDDKSCACISFIRKSKAILVFTFLFTFLGLTNVFGQSPSTFTTSGTWTCPRGVTSVQVEAWGGGAGGKNTPNTNNANGGGGGGGAYSRRNSITVVPGTTYSFTIGNGGAADAAGTATTATINGVTITANGGSVGTASIIAGGLGGAGGTFTAVVNGDAGFSGGNGANGTYLGGNTGNGGGGGGGAGTTNTGFSGAGTTGGAVRASFGGAGGNGGVSAIGLSAPIVAGSYGGGGGGAGHKNNTGGAGRGGAIIFTFVCPNETATAGPDQSVACGLTSTTLAGNTPTSAGLNGTWSVTSGTATITSPNSATSGVTGLAVTGTATLRWTINNGLCGTTFDEVIITTNATPSITTNPTNSSIAVGANTSFTVVGSNTPTSYTWQVSTNGGGIWTTIVNGGVYSNATTATLNITGATLAMNGYQYRASATNACGTSSYSTIATLTTTLTYCTPTGSGNTYPISNVTFAGINNSSSATVTPTPYYQNFSAITGNVIAGQTYSFTATATGLTGQPFGIYVYFDWNNNGNFDDDGGVITVGTYNTATATASINITVPLTANTFAPIRFRVINQFNVAPPSCPVTGTLQVEDYSLSIAAPAPCVVPTAQPTALSLNPAGTTIAGGFIAASPAANSYLVVVSTSATPPSAPVNGTSYTIGGTLAPGYIIVDNDSNTTFTATGLTTLTPYYFYIYSFNNVCTGGPLYLGTSPLTGNTTTTSVDYCTPTISATYATSTNHHIRKVEFIGTLLDVTNTSTFTSTAPIGYENYTGLAVKSIQAKGEGVNIYMESPNSGYIKAWVDWNIDGDFLDAGETVYDAGGVSQASTTLGFIVPTTISAGDYRVRLRISGRNGAGADAGIAWDACSTNLAYFGETEDYILRVIENCPVKITTLTSGNVCGSGSVTLTVTGTAGTTQFRWYSAQTGGTLLATTATGTWNTPVISTSTIYWVTAFNGTCETLVRAKITAIVKTVPTLTFATSTTEVCGENSIVALTAGGDTETIHLLNENFEAGLGTFSNVHYVSNAAVNATTAWQIKTGPYVPTGLTWYPAIASNFGANNFAFVNSDIGTYTGPPSMTTYYYVVDNGLVSNTVNSTGFLDLTFKFRMYFDRYYPNTVFPTDELMTIDVSTNGGTTWTALSGDIIADVGYGTRFTDYSYNLSAYINQTNLKVRIRYYTSTWANGGAVDDIELYGTKALNTAFQWTGTSLPNAYIDGAATIPYTAGTPAAIVYIKPTLAQLENGSYTFTATATLTNGCNVSQNITITNKSKIWKGSVDNNWYNTNNWSPIGVPDANSCVIIPDIATTSNRPSEINTSSSSAFGKYLDVKSNGVLKIYPSNNLTIGETISVAATGLIDMENSANLVQISNVANTGNIRMKRTASVRRQDYVYWSSPVASFLSNAVSPATGLGYQYKWLPTTGGINNFGNWSFVNETMVLGKGYCLRAPDAYSLSTAANYTATFIGVPNNGNITIPIVRGTWNGGTYSTGVSTTLGTNEDDNWNLVGNPYPSAINAIKFLTLNTNIAGFVNIWTHGTLPSNAIVDPFYNDYVYNYTATDYITYNSTGTSTPLGFNGLIGAGQGFFISMLHTSAATTENLIFNNDLRRDIPTGNTYNNGQFFRTTNENENLSSTEKLESHRIWFDLVSPSGTSARALLGYVENATDENDRLFDAFSNEKLSFNIFSLIDDERMLIQGRKLPFDKNDKVNIGVSIPQDGLYKIALGSVDGLFLDANQDIYLEDKLLNVIYNLRNAPYSFIDKKGTIKDRFVLRFSKDVNSNENIKEITNQLNVYDNDVLTVESGKLKIKNIQIFDGLGKQLLSKNDINNTAYQITTVSRTNSLMIVKVTLDDNSEEVRKVIY